MRRAAVTTPAIVVVFIVLSFLTLAFKSYISLALFSPVDSFTADHADWVGVCIDAGRPCLRATTAILGQSFEAAYRMVAGLFFWGVEGSPFFAGSPWEIQDAKASQVLNWYVPLSAYLSLGLVLLLPLLLVCQRFFESLAQKTLFLLASFSALIGWHPVPVNLFFNAAETFVDWPRSYYLFSSTFRHYDFGTIAVLSLALVYLARPGRRGWLGLAAFATLAQTTFENLGLVFAAGVFFATLINELHEGRGAALRRAFADSLIAVGTAVLVAVVLSGIFLLVADKPEARPGNGAVTGFMSDAWWTVVNNNFGWIRSVIANVITMIVFPLVAGLLIGALGGLMGDASDKARRKAALSIVVAGGGLAFGFLVSVAVGLFFIAYPAEMGRQIAPLAVLTVVPAAKLAELLVLRFRRPVAA